MQEVTLQVNGTYLLRDRHIQGGGEGEVVEHFNKTQGKEALQGNIFEFFFPDTLKTTF